LSGCLRRRAMSSRIERAVEIDSNSVDLWPVCPSCGEYADAEDVSCDVCGARLWPNRRDLLDAAAINRKGEDA
jgi:hypothetical protein